MRPGGWITEAHGLGGLVARRALEDVGLMEDPPGSNRGPEIDEYLKRVGCPPAQPWCAAAVSAWFRDAGAKIPEKLAASTNEWMRWAKEHLLWTSTPAVGCAVIYGKDDHAEHIGVVVRLTPVVAEISGNTSLQGSAEREGFAVELKQVNAGWRLGYIRPVAVGT